MKLADFKVILEAALGTLDEMYAEEDMSQDEWMDQLQIAIPDEDEDGDED